MFLSRPWNLGGLECKYLLFTLMGGFFWRGTFLKYSLLPLESKSVLLVAVLLAAAGGGEHPFSVPNCFEGAPYIKLRCRREHSGASVKVRLAPGVSFFSERLTQKIGLNWTQHRQEPGFSWTQPVVTFLVMGWNYRNKSGS